MADYIEREAAVKRLLEMAETAGKNRLYYEQECMETAAEVISGFPAADVAPVVHGRWVYNPNGMDWNLGAWQCSVCKCNNNNLPGNDKYNPYIFQGSNYCPNCGAKMDEKEKDDD